MRCSGGRVARTATLIAAGAQIVGVVALVTLGLASDGPLVDPMRPLPVAAVYLSPAVLALARGRGPLLLAAAMTALVLAIFPFSVHSFVLGPIGLVYLAAYAQLPARQRVGPRVVTAVAVCPLLASAALVALLLHDDPACYTHYASGEVTVDRSPDSVTSGHVIAPADSDIVGGGCTSDTVVWWEAAGSLALSTAAVMSGLRLVPPWFPDEQTDEADPARPPDGRGTGEMV